MGETGMAEEVRGMARERVVRGGVLKWRQPQGGDRG